MTEPVDAVDLLVDRLAGAELPAPVAELIIAACVGDEALVGALYEDASPARPARSEEPQGRPPPLFLGSIEVEGFRGIAGPARLGLRPGPGITLVVGRNGSGKSSFAEAAELALTETSSRWANKRSKEWEQGWACLHHTGGRSIEVRLVADGQPGSTIVRRRWAPDARLDDGVASSQTRGDREAPLAELGLAPALSTWRPFLAYNDLGGLIEDGPSRLYDAISGVLGLEEWVAVEERLSTARKALESTVRTAKAEAARLRGVLGELDDEQASAALAAIPERGAWDLQAVESLAAGTAVPTGQLASLQAISVLAPVDRHELVRCAEELRQAHAQMVALAGTDGARAAELADLLERAVALHRHTDVADCPVCGTPSVLGPQWVNQASRQVEALRSEAATVRQARKHLDGAEAAARALISPPPAALGEPGVGVDTTDLARVWAAWHQPPQEAPALADHLERLGEELAVAVDTIRAAAAAEVDRRRDTWQPVATQLAAWLPQAKRAQDSAGRVADLRKAEHWMAEEANAVRNERFEPIARRCRELWSMLRRDSNVELGDVTLEGAKTRRRVGLDVSVDGVDGTALSVMSQGELHALTLALFLPRATLTDSPFRFLLIDDPVQAMDASRVEGLALVLHDIATTHQVVVFTHDERLPDACRYLKLAANVLEVTRGERSQVTIRSRNNPVDDYLDDARAILLTEGYPPEARRRVVPGLCRNALEAACVDATRRRLLAKGVPLAAIDDRIAVAGKLYPRLALALFGDAERSGDVLNDVNRRFGRDGGDCVTALNAGSHRLIDDNPDQLVAVTGRIAHAIVELP